MKGMEIMEEGFMWGTFALRGRGKRGTRGGGGVVMRWHEGSRGWDAAVEGDGWRRWGRGGGGGGVMECERVGLGGWGGYGKSERGQDSKALKAVGREGVWECV